MLEGILPQINAPVTLLGMVLVLFLLYLISSTSGPGKEPPGPRPLPLLGNLLTLDLKLLQVSLCEDKQIYSLQNENASSVSPAVKEIWICVFTIHLGLNKLVVLAGYKTVKQALVNYAEQFGDREIAPIFRDTLQGHGEPFDTNQPVNCSVSNIICAIVYGTRFDYADPTFKKMVDRANENFRLLGSTEIRSLQLYNMFPWLRWCCGWLLMNRTQTWENTKNNLEEMKGLVQGLRDTLNPQDLRGFVDFFLLRQQEESDQLGSYFHNNNLHYTVSNLFGAGTDTTGTTLRWGLRLMAKYPHIQGRRSCPGESLARMELFLFFTFLLQRFRFTPPPGVSEDALDLTPRLGFTLNPSPHRLCAVSRA